MGPPQSNVNTARLDGIAQPVRSQFRSFIAATSGARRVWLFTLVLTALTVCLALVLVPSEPPIPLPFEVPVWLIAAGFYLAEAKVIHLHIGRSAHSFSMSELPLVAGLFLVSPPAFIVARLIGSGLALFFNRRQRSVKLAFNLAQFGLRLGRLRRHRPRGGAGRRLVRARAVDRGPRWWPLSRTSSACSASARRSRWPRGPPSTGASRRCSRSGSSSR